MKTNTTTFWRLAVDYGSMRPDKLRHTNLGNCGYGPREATLVVLQRAAVTRETSVGGKR